MVVEAMNEVAFQLSKLLELVFDAIEYQEAKHAGSRMAKQKRKALRDLQHSKSATHKVHLDHLNNSDSGKTTITAHEEQILDLT